MPEEKKEDKIEEKEVKEVQTEHHVEHHSENPVNNPNPTHSEHIEHKEHSEKTKKVNWMRLGIFIIIIALILILVWPGKVLMHKGITGQKTNMLNLSYSVYGNGALITSNSGLFTEGSIDNQLSFVSDKLDKEIATMKSGEEKNITLTAAEAYGNCDSSKINFFPNRTQEIPREQDINRTMNISTSLFNSTFGEMPQLNQVYEPLGTAGTSWSYKVVALNNENATLSIEAEIGQEFPASYFVTRVITLTADKITLRIEGNNSIIPSAMGDIQINFTQDKMILTLTPQIGQEIEISDIPKGRVVALNATTITIDSNPALCGQSVTVDVKLLGKQTQTSSTGSAIKHIDGAPTMQVFIMSHCPYGTQMVKGVLPVWRAFLNKANIEIRFVSYTMHGAQEDLDNSRIICIREEQSAKLIDYLDCFVHADGTEAGAQSCIVQVGIDKTNLDACVASRAAGYYDADKALNTQYSVQGSPTVIIDGTEASVYPRDPTTVAKALCDAFTTKPAECSQTFSTTNPAPGFGPDGTSGSSGTNASCG